MEKLFSKLKSMDQYEHLLQFAVKIRGGDIQQMLRSLVSCGFAQAVSFWSIDSHYHVHSPMTCNRPQRNILRFQNMMWENARGPIACRQQEVQTMTVEAANHFSAEYTQRLAMEGLRPCYNLYLRYDGSLAGGAMVILFLPLNFPETNMQSPELLECLQSLMEQEYQIISRHKQEEIHTDFLLQIMERHNVGLAVFDWQEKKNIRYANSHFLTHCRSILKDVDQVTALDRLLLKAFNFREHPGPNFKGLDLVIRDQEGKNFNLYLMEYEIVSGNKAYAVILSPALSQEVSLVQPPHSLTDREKNVVFLMIRGKKNQDIAQELNISISTVKKHIQSIFQKMNVSNRASLIAKLYEESEPTTNGGV